jgi:hypothetical protein
MQRPRVLLMALQGLTFIEICVKTSLRTAPRGSQNSVLQWLCYDLDVRGILIRFPKATTYLSLLKGFGAHPSLLFNGWRGTLSPDRGVNLATELNLIQSVKNERKCNSLSRMSPWLLRRQLLTLPLLMGFLWGIHGPLTRTLVNLSPRLCINNVLMIQYDYCVQMAMRLGIRPYKSL